MRMILFILSFCIFPFNLLFWRAFFPKRQEIPTIRVQHEDVSSGWGEAKRSFGRQVGKNLGNRVS